MIKALIVEDNEIVRGSLVKFFNKEPDITIVAEAATGSEAIAKLAEGSVANLAIIDWNMPDMSGLELTRLLTGKFPDVKAVILTMHSKREYNDKAKSEGAKGYLLKDMDFEDLANAIRKVAGGEEIFM